MIFERELYSKPQITDNKTKLSIHVICSWFWKGSVCLSDILIYLKYSSLITTCWILCNTLLCLFTSKRRHQ